MRDGIPVFGFRRYGLPFAERQHIESKAGTRRIINLAE